MAALGRVKFFTPSLIQCRHKSKHYIQRPRPAHLDRRIFEAVTIPVLPENLKDPKATCPRLRRALETKKDEKVQHEMENKYEKYLIGLCHRMLEENKMIIAFQPMSISAHEKVEIKGQLRKQGLMLRFVPNDIFRKTIKDTRWENLSPLLCSYNAYVVSPEIDVSKVIKITQKMPELVLLGGLVGERLYSREGLQTYAKLPSIDILRGELVAVLNAASGKTKTLLGQHQQALARNLEQYVKDNTANN